MTDRDDNSDPLLVRPYLLDEPGGAAPGASTQTWPEAAAEPVAAPEPPDPTVPIRVPVVPPRRWRRRPPLLAATVLTLVLVGAVALAASLLPERRTPSALPIDIPPPSLLRPSPAGAGPAPAASAASAAAARVTAAATRPRATASSPTAPAAPPAGTPRVAPGTGAPGADPALPAASPAGNRLIPPPADRVGRIRGAGGLCLDLNGALVIDGNHIQVFTCNDTAAQGWTVAADGTLRVVGRCAAVADDGTVRIAGCDDRRAAQWRPGPDGSLVSVATEGCLTDPSAGATSGTGVRVEPCTAADAQRWQLP